MLVHCNFADFLIDYYIDRKQKQDQDSPERNQKLLQLMAGAALHITVRSPEESVAWTLLLQDEQPYSVFVTASPSENILVGQILTENIRHTDINIFHSQISRSKGKVSNSSIRCEVDDIELMVETFYEKSEQLPLKASLLRDNDDAIILVGMPQVDMGWFEQNEPAQVFDELESYSPKLMKQCNFRFACNCSAEKLLPYLRAVSKEQLEELYGDDENIVVNCPRCGKNFGIKRTMLIGDC